MTYDPWKSEAEKHEKTQYSDIREMKFKDDSDHQIRIMPAIEDDAPPFYGYVIHWIPQQNSKKGKPIVHKKENRCGVCKYVSDLWTEINRLKEEEDLTEKSPKVKTIYEKIQAVGGKEKYDFNILDRDDMEHEVEKDGKKKKRIAVKRMTAPSTIWQAIFNYAKNPKWGSPSDRKTGYDFDITTEGKGVRRQYTVAPDRTSSPLTKEEIEAFETCYDLAKLRKPTSAKDIKDFLENAKSPYDEIINYLTEDDGIEEETNKRKKNVEEDEKQQKVKKEVQESDDDDDDSKDNDDDSKDNDDDSKDNDSKDDSKESKNEDDEDEDKYNLDNYECKGDFEESEELCQECPVKENCIEFQPYFKKAKELKISVAPERNVKEIVKDVKEAAGNIESKTPIRGKRKKDLPF
jgi:hypothetical protein